MGAMGTMRMRCELCITPILRVLKFSDSSIILIIPIAQDKKRARRSRQAQTRN